MKEQTSAAVFRMPACGKHTPPGGAAARGGIQKKRTPGFPDIHLFSVMVAHYFLLPHSDWHFFLQPSPFFSPHFFLQQSPFFFLQHCSVFGLSHFFFLSGHWADTPMQNRAMAAIIIIFFIIFLYYL
uniref:hypothetical protein n=1 Tax=Alloprevotella sp. TaxID=1872471 RepID=UPI004029D06E